MRIRVNVYIDGSNFYRACKGELNRTDVSIGDFANKLVGNREHGRTYYYNVKVSPNFNRGAYETQKRFFTALYRTPYLEVRLGRHVRRGKSWMEKGVDMRLGIDLLNHAFKNLYDIAVVVSGDGDFEYAIQAVKETGKHVEVAYFERSTSLTLLKSSDFLHELNPSFFDELYIHTS